MSHDYRLSFRSDKSAENYEARVYKKGSAADIWWEVEKKQLSDFIESHFKARNDVSYLDFACGTGRVCSFLEEYFDDIDALDISPEMIEVARQKCQKTRFIAGDITAEATDHLNLSSYDLITAFRFLANSQESLRISVIENLGRMMRDNQSVLVINNHGNPYSHRLLFLPYHYLKDKIGKRDFYGYLTNGKVRRYLEDAGLEVIAVKGSGFVPTQLRDFLPEFVCRSMERALSSVNILQKFGVNQMFFCRTK